MVFQTVDADLLDGLDDHKILSLFTHGFFGGHVLGIERILLRAGAWNLLPVHFNGQIPLGIEKRPRKKCKLLNLTSIFYGHAATNYLALV